MDRRRALLNVWNWLPPFQVVAETEHLPTASARLKVTPSALSRSITMLEDRLGRPLFTRRGRQLVLNADGRRLLAGMATAFEVLDRSIAELSGGNLGGPLYASVAGPLAQSLVVSALHELRSRATDLVPYVYGYDHEEAIRLVRAGQIDVAFDPVRVEAKDLVSTFIGEAGNRVYCGREHPLFFAARGAERSNVLEHGFVATCSAAGDRATDAFPADVARNVEMYVQQVSVALDTCLGGHLLAVLPECVAHASAREGDLRHIPFEGLPPTMLFATCARERANDPRIVAVVAAVRQALSAALERSPSEPATHAMDRRKSTVDPAPPPAEEEGWLAAGDALATRGELRAARASYDAAHVERRKTAGDAIADAAHHALRVARVLVREGKFVEAEKLCADAVVALAQRGSSLAAALEAACALACCFRGDPKSAAEALHRAREHVATDASRDQRGTARLRALVHRAEGNLFVLLGRPGEAIRTYSQGALLAESGGDGWEHSVALFNLAEAHALVGDREQVHRLLDAAARAKEDIADRWGLAYVHHLRARMTLREHEADAATALAATALHLAVDLGDPKLVSMCNATLGEAHLTRGELDEAHRVLELARQGAEQCGARAEEIRALIGLSAADLRRGKRSSARRHADRARLLADGAGTGAALAATLIALANVATADGRDAEASSLYRNALAAQQEQSGWPTL